MNKIDTEDKLKKSTKYFVQIVNVKGIDIRPRQWYKEVKNWNGSKKRVPLRENEVQSIEFFAGNKQKRHDWESSAEKIFNEKPELVPLFVSGTAIEVMDEKRCLTGLNYVRSIIDTSGNVCIQVNIFPTGLPG